MHRLSGHLRLTCVLACGLCVLGASVLAGCADKNGDGRRRGFLERRDSDRTRPSSADARRQKLERLPRLDELAQGDDPKQTPLADSGVVAAAALTRVWLPADQTINDIWREASTVSLSDVELLAWHRNQLRAALVSKQKLNEIIRQMPAHFGLQQQVMTLSGELIPLDPANARAAHSPVSLEINGATKTYTGGRMQLLVSATSQTVASENSPAYTVLKLTILPHMYVPKVTLLPRDHMQAALDGRIFSELMLRVLMSSEQVLLIAPDVPVPVFDDTRPPPSEPKADEASSTQGAQGMQSEPSSVTTQPAGKQEPVSQRQALEAGNDASVDKPLNQPLDIPPLSTEPEIKPVPFGLGQAVLTGRQHKRVLHQLWILEVRPLTVAEPPSPDSSKDEMAN